MTTCKAAWLVVRAHLPQLLAYLIGLGMLAALLAWGTVGSTSQTGAQTFDPPRNNVAIIDRDSDGGHCVGDALRTYLASNANLVDIEDSETAIDDAIATQQADFIVIVPQGYADDFTSAVKNSTDMPRLGSVGSGGSGSNDGGSESAVSAMEGIRINGFLNSARTALIANPESDVNAAFDTAIHTAQDLRTTPTASVRSTAPDSQASGSQQTQADIEGFAPSLVFRDSCAAMIYAVIMSVSLAVILVMTEFNAPRTRERIRVSAQNPASARWQLLLVCSAIGVAMWLCCLAIALGACMTRGAGLASVNAVSLALSATSLFVLCLVCVAFGFLVAQFHVTAATANGIVNTIGLVSAFLSGAWLPQWLMSPSVAAVAKILPGWWFVDSLNQAFGGDASVIAAPNMNGWACSTALMAAFGVGFVVCAVIVGRVRSR